MREPQRRLFSAKTFVNDSDLMRLERVLEVLPDAELVRRLLVTEKGCAQGRKRRHHPRALLHILIAGVVYRHRFVANLLGELKRNSDLREAVGLWGAKDVPEPYEMSRFLSRLVKEESLIEEMFATLVREVRRYLPNFGETQAADATHIYSYARGKKEREESSDKEATFGVKRKLKKRKDGTPYERVFSWFGYKLHLLVDSIYELPLSFILTTASRDEAKELLPLVEQARCHLEGTAWDRKAWENEQAERKRLEKAGVDPGPVSDRFEDAKLSADKGYDETELYREVHEQYRIKPVIALIDRKDPKTGESVYERERVTRVRNDVTGEYKDLRFCGYEKDRGTLKYTCPCDGTGRCPFFGAQCNKKDGGAGVIVRVKLKENWRYYTPVARGTKKWKREYNRRTAVERVNGRLKQVLEIERSGLRGKAKIQVRCALGLLVMLAHAVSCLRAGKAERLRSMKKPAA